MLEHEETKRRYNGLHRCCTTGQRIDTCRQQIDEPTGLSQCFPYIQARAIVRNFSIPATLGVLSVVPSCHVSCRMLSPCLMGRTGCSQNLDDMSCSSRGYPYFRVGGGKDGRAVLSTVRTIILLLC